MLVVAWLAPAPSHAVAQEGPSLSGTIWEDVNADGLRQPEEPGIPYHPVRLHPAGQERPRNVWTDESGAYTFTGLTGGRYQVGFASNSFLTYPFKSGAGTYLIQVNVGAEAVSSIDFGVHRPSGRASFIGDIWIDAQPGYGKVRAFIGESDCTAPVAVVPPPHSGDYYLSVAPSYILPGCGDEGDTIRFEVDGIEANETAQWRIRTSQEFPSYGFEPLNLTVGPPFGYLTLTSETPSGKSDTPELGTVFAYVDGVVCAENEGYGQGGTMIVLRSLAYTNGCGHAGATIVIVRDGLEVGRFAWSEGFLGEHEVPWYPRADLVSDPSYYEWVYGRPLPTEASTPQVISPPSVGDAGLR
jgi:hypothetical protein